MKKASFYLIPLLLFSAMLLSPAAAPAAVVEVTASSPTVYVVQGSGLSNIGGIDITITYDSAALRNPKVERGSIISNAPGSMFIPNAATPGLIRIAAVNASSGFNGAGSIAILTFEKIGNSKKPITSLASKLADVQAKSVDDKDVTTSIQDPTDAGDGGGNQSGDKGGDSQGGGNKGGDSQGGGNKGGGTTGGYTSGGTSTVGTWLGSVAMPGQEPERAKETPKQMEPLQTPPEEPQHQAASIPREPETSAPSREEAKPGEKKFVPHKTLLEEFRDVKEPKTPQSLVALFQSFQVPGARQEPEVALSDGKTKVTVYIDLPAAGKEAPNFALKGAKLVSLKNEAKDRWVLEALPVKNSNDVKVTALQDNVMTEIPLVVAQPIAPTAASKNGKLDAAAFATFLKEQGTDKAPQFDLNGDKARNYIDDYIFTANYIVKNGIKRTASAPKQKEENAKAPAKAPAMAK